ncbi:carbon monoxide dehydrogenase [Blastococcus sp. KM273128]|uniref:CoxG family protein n=1 Tax=Blastococcus sp. KM273128 TaxID=2570314 RepID=UPI001F3AE67F|nr:carbon monoxide dehydrogenase subunit G [Blastococcus sp. KM273128]MCF6744207.1 carbon monoxide dehydrogenase [Blastococcus sp. KM273128]
MKLDGSAVLHGDPEKVWAVITDPAVLARTIPGCESLEQVGDDEYKMNVSVGVGAIKGTYAGEVRLSDKEHPKSYVMHASGAGAPGNARATVTIGLDDAGDGKTNLSYSADAVIGGPVAGVGQRMITGVAKRMAGQFFKAIDAELTGTAVPVAVPSAAAVSSMDAEPAGTRAAPAPEGAPQVFTGRAGVPAGPSGDVQTLALGALGGAALTLIGVLVGYRLGRR